MRAALFKAPRSIEVGDRPDASISEPTDAVVRVALACVCGSDLWYYRGDSPFEPGPIGHEFMGVVEDVGSDVERHREGRLRDRAVRVQRRHLPALPPRGHVGLRRRRLLPDERRWRPGRGGARAARGRDARARAGLRPLGRDHALAAHADRCDGTGHHAAVCAGVKEGDTVAVVGDGAVGLCGVLAAQRLGAERIIALSRHADRQALAREFGATDIVEQRGEEAVETVLDDRRSRGRGALECVGTGQAMETAFSVVRPGSMVGYVGVPHGVELPIGEMFFRNKGVLGGSAPVRAYIPELLDDVLEGRINPGLVLDFETDLDGVAEAYAAMDERRAIKSLVRVGAA